MATAPNPQMMQLLAALQARNAMGGVPPGGAPAAVAGGHPTGPGPSAGGASPDAGSDYGSMLSDLRKADPGQTMRQLRFMKQILAAMLVHNLEPNPSISGKIAKVLPHIDNIIKEAERASSVNGAVRGPIQMGAAQPTPPNSPSAAGGVGPGAMGAAGPQGA